MMAVSAATLDDFYAQLLRPEPLVFEKVVAPFGLIPVIMALHQLRKWVHAAPSSLV